MPTILVTGATRGIGRAIAERFALGGWDVCCNARTADEVRALAALLSSQYAVRAWACPADVSSEAGALDVYRKLDGVKIDVLVNNAGQFAFGGLLEAAPQQLTQMLSANLYGAYFMCRAFGAGMKERGSGHVVNICSVASMQARAGIGCYTIAKHALWGLTKVLREELRPHGVRVTSIVPSSTYTSSWDGMPVPPERLMDAKDVAEAVWMSAMLSERSCAEEILLRPPLGDY